VAGNVQKGEAPTLLWERIEIRLDENLDSFLTGINLDTNGLVAKVNLVASNAVSAIGVWIWDLASSTPERTP
jgi:hypothetical protein